VKVELSPERRKPYPSDLTDEQWQLLQPLLKAEAGPGRPTEVDLREVLNTLLYMKQTGCQWSYIPHDLQPRSTVHYYFQKWTEDGTLEEMMKCLREQVRRKQGRAARPTAAVIDSQTVKSADASQEVGWDGGKWQNGRKRHVLVDTEGNILAVLVLAANSSDREGALRLLRLYRADYPELQQIWGDGHYGAELGEEVKAQYDVKLDAVKKAVGQKGFVPLPRRWVVERTFGWFMHCRRLVRDYERDPGYSEAWIYIATIHRMVKYLATDESARRPYHRPVAA
jgi:putative transposase